jgi:uncharacterized protein (DUF1330 family)
MVANVHSFSNNDHSNKHQNNMIYITQLIFIREGEEATFEEFEKMAIPIIAQYNGTLLFRHRPNKETVIEQNMETPYEIHLVEFESEQDFKAFLEDETRNQFIHLKEKSMASSWMIKGERR